MRTVTVLVAFLCFAVMRGDAPGQRASERAFEELERWFIVSYLEDDEGRERHRGPASADLTKLFPGDTLSSNFEVTDLPRELEERLPPLPEGLERVLVGDRVALVEKESRRIQDLFDPREAREKGPPRELAVCHVPPGNPSRRKTLSLPEPAMRSHLGHGDYIGRCR